MKYITFSGNLTTFYETGMEYLGLGIDMTRFQTLNPHYDPQDKNKGPQYYSSYEGLILLKKNDKIDIETPEGVVTFIIGNPSLAKAHQYKFGEAYPKELTDPKELSEWVKHFAPENIKGTITREVKKVAFYGGTFDPMHLGHKKIIEQLHYHFDEVCVVPTNNYLKKNFTFTLSERINAAQAVADNYSNVTVLDWALQMDTSKTYEMFLKLQSLYGIEPVIAIGEDNLVGIEKWQNFSQLKSLPFMIFHRAGAPVNDIPLTNYQFIKNFNISASSTAIRAENNIQNIPPECLKYYDLLKLAKD